MSDCIPPNPDISGIGVRIAIYAQNFLCFLPVVVHLWDGTISTDELDGIKDQSIGMLAIAFAILISTIVQAKSGGHNPTITNYHAAIVLDLSWINNTSTWIWFILYVHNRTKNKIECVPATWREWVQILREPLVELFTAPSGTDHDTSLLRPRPLQTLGARVRDFCRNLPVRIWNLATKESVLTLGSLHLSVMAAIGLWLWSNPTLFGSSLPSGCDPTLTVIGHEVLFSSRPLRIVSLMMYSLVLIPGVNLVLPFLFFLSLHIGYNHVRVAYNPLRGHLPAASTHFLIAGLAFLVLFNAFFVVDIEKTLQHNKGNQTGEDNEWGFGQVLAMLLLVVPLRDAWSALQNIRSKLRGVQGQFEDLFRRECEAAPIIEELQRLIDNGANVKQDTTSGRCFELAVCYEKEELVEFLLDKEVSLDAGGAYGTALCAACANGKTKMVKYLLGKGADLAVQGPFGAPLHVAVLAGELDIVKLLVEGDEDRQNKANCVWDPFGNAVDVGTMVGRGEAVCIMESQGLTGKITQLQALVQRTKKA
ncbi:hypothetical protein C8R47DRAFT_1102439 [Mycena vitilis]|nr:hypothetical protein C8R47DRAFT_1102439 [Mycena vitilis]